MGRKPVFGLAGLLLASTTLTGCWGDTNTVDAGRFAPPPPGSAARTQFGSSQPYAWSRTGNGQPQSIQQSPMMGTDPSQGQYPGMNGSPSIGQTQPGVQPMTQNPMMGGNVPAVQSPTLGTGTSSQWSTTPASGMGRSTSMTTPSWQSPSAGPQSSFPNGSQYPASVTNSGSPVMGGANSMNPSPFGAANGSSSAQVSQSTLRFVGNTNPSSPFASRTPPPLGNEYSPPDVSRPTPPAGYPALQSGAGSTSSANTGITPVGYNQSSMSMPPASDPPAPAAPGSFGSQSRYQEQIHDVSSGPPSPMGVPSVPVLR
jgi:hypothetical protein